MRSEWVDRSCSPTKRMFRWVWVIFWWAVFAAVCCGIVYAFYKDPGMLTIPALFILLTGGGMFFVWLFEDDCEESLDPGPDQGVQ